MTPVEKFQSLLRELFQFDSADLDFGIYRIMNYKRDVVEKFISTDLPKMINEELDRGTLAEQSQAAQELQAAREQVLDSLAEDALDAEGNLAEEYRNTKAGKAYLEAQARAAGSHSREALETAIYNHLYAFFSRYYQDGDFISKRRYSKKERYAIPYNGEEVYLHWANHDQYYIKTAEYFTDYTYKAPNGVTVHFKIKTADVEQNNVKGEKRFFLPRLDEVTWEPHLPEGETTGLALSGAEVVRDGQLIIPFEYRPLTAQEAISFGQKNQQEAITAKAVADIPKRVKVPEALAALTAEKRKKGDEQPVSNLAHHLRQYTRRNTSDFFIHKDLQSFLARELDFYLKNEVLNLEEMEAAGEGLGEGWFELIRLMKKIGNRIIEFLAQIENFQKLLWEKRKFIIETFYCITVGNIPETFYQEIAACEAQWDEWKMLFHVEVPATENKRIAFLKDHPALVLDTRHFTSDRSTSSRQNFVDRLLACYIDLDGMTDGLLVHGENWQTLNLFGEKYRERVKCIYIDPPYNTGKDGFPYKDQYQHSSWLSMLIPRVSVSFALLSGDGVIFSSLDRNEFSNLQAAIRQTLPTVVQVGELVWHNARDNNPTQIAQEHEYILCLGKSPLVLNAPWKSPFSDAKEILLQEYDSLKAQELSLSRIQLEIRAFIKANREMLGEIDRYKHVDEGGIYTGSESVHNPHPGGYDYDIEHPVTRKPMRKPANGYRFPQTTMRHEFIEKDRLIYGPDENRIVKIKLYLEDYQDSLRSVITLDGRLGAYSIRDLFAEGESFFSNPKPVQLIQRVIGFVKSENAIVMDFFAGSGSTGQAVVTMNRVSKQNLSFILVDMDTNFDRVMLPRIKKVTFSPEWKMGKPKRMTTTEEAEHSPRIVKIIRLESFEDALNNIAFDEASGQQVLQFEDYLLQYMLEWETRHSETLLNVEKLSSPFSYQLRIHRNGETRTQFVDLPETFNYLIGLSVQTRRVLSLEKNDENHEYYLVYRGVTRTGRNTVVIWRETKGWTQDDFQRDKDFVTEHKLADGADEIYVNGDSLIPGARALEGLFKARMFAPVEA